ncbi:sodium-dependent nutrient amino acid transporter 1 [Drosophila pseudoobscura]|uniref:Sodium-dependent nutrient amino acid transporter 1 n=2 Tax=Drosophila pseudoobscura pseudoobscura TaxID=46245 RepID=NAAT1_DROPS|nr:sodium-dependent nutrient amino acid transporter 1 [Drosophila pseudoobscura]Q29GB8.1 RecName: Full=Sodium-dependent nutrient amino acid transporter 1 [Drosophila pseudoobscura pseudoobscura]
MELKGVHQQNGTSNGTGAAGTEGESPPPAPAPATAEAAASLETTTEKVDAEQQKTERTNWGNGLEFLMSCISVSVGLGNVWRFPFTAYENGGGAFLIPYIIVLFLIGKPMYYLEMIMGQFTSQGTVKIWSVVPGFVGVGYGQAFATICIITYYSSLLALTLFYLFVSFQSVLPWSYCWEEWMNCVDSRPQEDTDALLLSSSNVTNVTALTDTVKLQSSSELYFLNVVIKEKMDISDGIGDPDWKLTLALFVSWVVIFLVIMRGVKSSGKAAYFLALFPYVVLFILLVRAVTLEGARDGIIFFLEPQWGELLNPTVWKNAVVQCFFSLAVGSGPIIMFASYNRFDHGIYRDAMIVTTLDTLTSLLGGITIFAILGNLAHNLQIENIRDVVRSGTGLAFISYPDAISKFQAVPQLFSVLFFFMLFVLGIGSIVALQSTIVTILCDQFKSWKYWKVALATSICGFLMGLVYVTPGGQWILTLVDFYGGTYVVFILAIFELAGIVWIYGMQNFCDDVEFMCNRRVSLYWRVCWSFFTPVMMIVIFIYSMVTIEPITYSEQFFPEAGNVAGWLLFGIGAAQFPLWWMWYISHHREGSLGQSFVASLRPSDKWGPANPETKRQWVIFKNEKAAQRATKKQSSKMGAFWQKLGHFCGSNT